MSEQKQALVVEYESPSEFRSQIRIGVVTEWLVDGTKVRGEVVSRTQATAGIREHATGRMVEVELVKIIRIVKGVG